MILNNFGGLAKLLVIFLILLIAVGSLIGGADLGFGPEEATGQTTITTEAGVDAISETPARTTTQSQISDLTQTMASTKTPTLTPTTIQTESPTPDDVERYGNFLVEMGGGLNKSIRTPLRIRGATIQEDVLYLVHNATSSKVNTTKKFVEWGDIAIAYAGAVRDTKSYYNDSEVPSRMVVFETNSSNILPNKPAKFVVTTEDAKEWNEENISGREFTKRWQDKLQRQEQRDIEFVEVIDRVKTNTTYYPDKPIDVEEE